MLASQTTGTRAVHSLYTSLDACSVLIATQEGVEIAHLHSLETYGAVTQASGADITSTVRTLFLFLFVIIYMISSYSYY